MSDFMEYAEYYKKAWEKSLKERTSELQEEIKRLKYENARYREALNWYECNMPPKDKIVAGKALRDKND